MIAVLLAACAHVPAQPLGDSERADVFAIEAHGHAIAGTALVVTADGATTLHALAPAGVDLFEVRVGDAGAVVTSPDPDLLVWLQRMPFERDLTALYRARCLADRCAWGAFRWTRDGDGWRITGPGGPATYTPVGDGWRLVDGRRGYTLSVYPAVVP